MTIYKGEIIQGYYFVEVKINDFIYWEYQENNQIRHRCKLESIYTTEEVILCNNKTEMN